jgi:MFS family permease
MTSSMLFRLGLQLKPQWRVYAAFFLYAFGLGGMFPRLGEIQRGLGIGEGALGLALIGAATGTLISLSFGGRLIVCWGHRKMLIGAMALLPLCYSAAAWAPSALLLFCILVPAGLLIGVIEVIVNLEADRVEHQTGQRFMNRAHGCWSLGFFAAGLLGALFAQWGISAQWHLALVVPVVWLAMVLLLGRFAPAPQRDPIAAEPPAHFARATRGVLLLVAVSLSAMVLEGAGAEWSAIYMRDVFGALPFVGGMAVAVGALAQGVTRFFADRFVERHQPVAVARVLLTVLGLGTLLVFFAPAAWTALLGFAMMGVGTAVIFPLAMSAAAQRTDRAPATNVAALAQTAFVAYLLGPPLLGLVAQQFGVRWSFGIGLPLVVLSLVCAGALRTGRQTG